MAVFFAAVGLVAGFVVIDFLAIGFLAFSVLAADLGDVLLLGDAFDIGFFVAIINLLETPKTYKVSVFMRRFRAVKCIESLF